MDTQSVVSHFSSISVASDMTYSDNRPKQQPHTYAVGKNGNIYIVYVGMKPQMVSDLYHLTKIEAHRQPIILFADNDEDNQRDKNEIRKHEDTHHWCMYDKTSFNEFAFGIITKYCNKEEQTILKNEAEWTNHVDQKLDDLTKFLHSGRDIIIPATRWNDSDYEHALLTYNNEDHLYLQEQFDELLAHASSVRFIADPNSMYDLLRDRYFLIDYETGSGRCPREEMLEYYNRTTKIEESTKEYMIDLMNEHMEKDKDPIPASTESQGIKLLQPYKHNNDEDPFRTKCIIPTCVMPASKANTIKEACTRCKIRHFGGREVSQLSATEIIDIIKKNGQQHKESDTAYRNKFKAVYKQKKLKLIQEEDVVPFSKRGRLILFPNDIDKEDIDALNERNRKHKGTDRRKTLIIYAEYEDNISKKQDEEFYEDNNIAGNTKEYFFQQCTYPKPVYPRKYASSFKLAGSTNRDWMGLALEYMKRGYDFVLPTMNRKMKKALANRRKKLQYYHEGIPFTSMQLLMDTEYENKPMLLFHQMTINELASRFGNVFKCNKNRRLKEMQDSDLQTVKKEIIKLSNVHEEVRKAEIEYYGLTNELFYTPHFKYHPMVSGFKDNGRWTCNNGRLVRMKAAINTQFISDLFNINHDIASNSKLDKESEYSIPKFAVECDWESFNNNEAPNTAKGMLIMELLAPECIIPLPINFPKHYSLEQILKILNPVFKKMFHYTTNGTDIVFEAIRKKDFTTYPQAKTAKTKWRCGVADGIKASTLRIINHCIENLEKQTAGTVRVRKVADLGMRRNGDRWTTKRLIVPQREANWQPLIITREMSTQWQTDKENENSEAEDDENESSSADEGESEDEDNDVNMQDENNDNDANMSDQKADNEAVNEDEQKESEWTTTQQTDGAMSQEEEEEDSDMQLDDDKMLFIDKEKHKHAGFIKSKDQYNEIAKQLPKHKSQIVMAIENHSNEFIRMRYEQNPRMPLFFTSEDHNETCTIHIAASVGNFEAIKWIMKQHKEEEVIGRIDNRTGNSILHTAVLAKQDTITFMEQLINFMENHKMYTAWTSLLQHKNKKKLYALHLAVHHDERARAALLMRYIKRFENIRKKHIQSQILSNQPEKEMAEIHNESDIFKEMKRIQTAKVRKRNTLTPTKKRFQGDLISPARNKQRVIYDKNGNDLIVSDEDEDAISELGDEDATPELDADYLTPTEAEEEDLVRNKNKKRREIKRVKDKNTKTNKRKPQTASTRRQKELELALQASQQDEDDRIKQQETTKNVVKEKRKSSHSKQEAE